MAREHSLMQRMMCEVCRHLTVLAVERQHLCVNWLQVKHLCSTPPTLCSQQQSFVGPDGHAVKNDRTGTVCYLKACASAILNDVGLPHSNNHSDVRMSCLAASRSARSDNSTQEFVSVLKKRMSNFH